ncbi:MAG TPA: hypothetical protein H9921_02870 [Candidatus Mediterraneibacter caccogallinarum]|nr:hypothetical protein [Candidatus Mediterraneibacter caccogallinarum]
MIDFTKFVNSNAVRNHLQQIRYQPTAMEAAWLVWQCETISLEEKYTAWHKIIDTLPDCPTDSLTSRLKKEYKDSTHAFLRAYIAQQKELTAAFYQADEPAVYHAEYQILPKGKLFWREHRSIEEGFPTLESTLQAIPKNEGEIIYITIYKENSRGDFLMAARFLPNQRLAFMDARPGSMCACNMSKDRWALYTGVLYYIGRVSTWKNIPLPFRSGDILYNPNMPEGMFCGGVFIAVETKSQRCDGGFFLYDNKPDKICHLYPRLMDCEYYPMEALSECYRIFPLISKFLKGKNIALDPWDFAELINDYHDLLIPPAVPEETEADDDGDGLSITMQIAKVPAGMDFEEFIDIMENDNE